MSCNNNKHSIKSLLYDIIFDDERRAQELYDDIRRLHYKELEDTISHCINEIIHTDSHARIDQLELDLGTIHYRDINSDLVQRVYDSLSERLKELFRGDNQLNRLEILSFANRMTFLRHYFLHGYLPWNTKENVVELILYCLQNQSEELTLLFRDIGRLAKVRKRIVSRFDTHLVAQMIELLASSEYNLIDNYHRLLFHAIERHDILSIPKSRIGSSIWHVILNYLLLNPNSQYKPSLLIKDTLIQFCEKFKIDFVGIVGILYVEVNQLNSANGSALKDGIYEVKRSLRKDGLIITREYRDNNALTFVQKTEMLTRLLLNKTIPIELRYNQHYLLRQHLIYILKADSEVITDLMGKSVTVDILVKQINQHFGIKPVLALVKSIEPIHFKSIVNFHKDVIFTHHKDPFTSVSEKLFSENLWIIILKTLLNKSGSHFNKLAFLRHLIQGLSNRYNIKFHILILRFQRIAQMISSGSSSMPEFIDLLGQIYSEDRHTIVVEKLAVNSAKDHNDVTDDTIKLKKPLWGKNDMYSMLESYFLNKCNMTSLERVRGMLFECLEKNPSWLLRSIKKRVDQKNLIDRIIHDFDEGLIEALLKSFNPYNYQVVTDYNHAIHVLQNKTQFFGSSSTGFMDTQLSISFQVLLDQPSTHYSQINILNDLLSASSKHFGVAPRDLLFQMKGGERKNNPDIIYSPLLIQLFQELHLEDNEVYKNAKDVQNANIEGTIDSSERIPLDPNMEVFRKRNSDSLLDVIIQAVIYPTSSLVHRGFKNISEALQHILIYQKDELLAKLRSLQMTQLNTFTTNLNEKEIGILFEACKSDTTSRIYEFVDKLNLRLYNFKVKDRQELIGRVSVKCLKFIIKHSTTSQDNLLHELEVVMDEYHYPNGFFEERKAWTIPVKGDVENNILGLEERLSRDLQGQLLSKSKTAIWVGELLEMNKQNSSSIAMPRKQKLNEFEDIYISNAGLVILNGYLNYFFQELGYLNEDGLFHSVKASRAAVVMQYLFNPEGVLREEEMVLNKLICGIPINDILPVDIEISDVERDMSIRMIEAIIEHWTMINNSSIEGFRESWLFREGRLIKKDKHWELLVEKRAFDILLDYKPFTISPVKFQWMKESINVKWR